EDVPQADSLLFGQPGDAVRAHLVSVYRRPGRRAQWFRALGPRACGTSFRGGNHGGAGSLRSWDGLPVRAAHCDRGFMKTGIGIAITFAAVAAAPAAAQQADDHVRIVTIGAGVQATPRYPGAGESRFGPLPRLQLDRPGEP